jgi:hypothetical protein
LNLRNQIKLPFVEIGAQYFAADFDSKLCHECTSCWNPELHSSCRVNVDQIIPCSKE